MSELPYHLIASARWDELHDTLTDFGFLQAKVTAGGPQPLIDDYSLALAAGYEKRALSLIRDALGLSAHVLAQDDSQLAGHLIARLSDDDDPGVRRIILNAHPRTEGAWLHPLTASLAPPGGPLERTLFGHNAEITALSITEDQVISASADHTIKMWDWERGQVNAILDGHKASIDALAVAPQAGLILSGSRDGEIRRWRFPDGTDAGVFVPAGAESVSHLAVTPDGSRAVSIHSTFVHMELNRKGGTSKFSGSVDRTLRVWDLQRGKQIAEITGDYDRWALAADLTRAVSAYSDHLIADPNLLRTLVVWDLDSGRAVRRIKGPKGTVTALELTSGGMIIAAYNIKDRGTALTCWDLKRGKRGPRIEGDWLVFKMQSTPDGQIVVFADSGIFQDEWVWRWDLGGRGRQVTRLERGDRALPKVGAIIPHPTEPWMVTIPGVVTVWDLNRGEVVFQLPNPAKHFVIAPDGRHAISGTADGVIHMWRLNSEAFEVKPTGHVGAITATVVQPDGGWVFTGSQDGSLGLWSTTKDRFIQLPKTRQAAIKDLVFCPESHRLVGMSGSSILVWKIPGGDLLQSIQAARGTIDFFVATPNGRCAISGAGGIETTPVVWDLNTGKRVGEIPGIVPNRGSQYALDYAATAVSPDGRFFIAGVEKEIVVWEISAQREVVRLGAPIFTPGRSSMKVGGHSSRVTTVAVSPNGRLLASSDTKKVILWNISLPSGSQQFAATGVKEMQGSDEILSFTGFSSLVHTLVFIDHGQKLLCAAHNQLRIYDVSNGIPVCKIDYAGAFASKVSISANGRWIAAITVKGHLRLWDTTTGEPVTSFIGETPILASTISADGTLLVAGESSGSVHLLAVDTPAKPAMGLSAPTKGESAVLERMKPAALQKQDNFVRALDTMSGIDGSISGTGSSKLPLIVTAVDNGNGPVLRCPVCQHQFLVEKDWLGNEISCTNPNCLAALRLNVFVARSSQPNKSTDMIEQKDSGAKTSTKEQKKRQFWKR